MALPDLPLEIWGRNGRFRCKTGTTLADECDLWLDIRLLDQTFARVVEKFMKQRYFRRGTVILDLRSDFGDNEVIDLDFDSIDIAHLRLAMFKNKNNDQRLPFEKRILRTVERSLDADDFWEPILLKAYRFQRVCSSSAVYASFH